MIAWEQRIQTGSAASDHYAVETARAHAASQGLYFQSIALAEGGFIVRASQGPPGAPGAPAPAIAASAFAPQPSASAPAQPAVAFNVYGAPQALASTASPGMHGMLRGVGCESCGRDAPRMQVTLLQNIGLLVARTHKTLSGQLCKRCISSHGWRMTGITALFGWWGVISFFFTLIILPTNLVMLVRARSLPDEHG